MKTIQGDSAISPSISLRVSTDNLVLPIGSDLLSRNRDEFLATLAHSGRSAQWVLSPIFERAS